MKVNQEIERKFIVTQLPPAGAVRIERMASAYLSSLDPEVRIARFEYSTADRMGDRIVAEPGSYQLTLKKGNGISRAEIIIPVSDAVGDGLWEMSEPETRLVKIREWYKHDWELDIYLGRHAPLMIVEIELPHEDAQLPPLPTGMVLGAEVTYDEEFKNKALVGLSDARIAELCDRYNCGPK